MPDNRIKVELRAVGAGICTLFEGDNHLGLAAFARLRQHPPYLPAQRVGAVPVSVPNSPRMSLGARPSIPFSVPCWSNHYHA
jgi:hypothetical protein